MSPKSKRSAPKPQAFSWRRSAAIVLAELDLCAAIMRRDGTTLPAVPWLKVLANVLSSFPARRGPVAPRFFGLDKRTLFDAATICGLTVSWDEIELQVLDTEKWRRGLLDRPYRRMRMDTIGKLLGITDAIRAEAKAWNVGTIDGSPKARAEARKQRERLRHENLRRVAGKKPHAESLSRTKPWEAEGLSRRAWYRRREGDPDAVAQISTRPLMADAVAQKSTAQKSTRPLRRVAQKSTRPLSPLPTNSPRIGESIGRQKGKTGSFDGRPPLGEEPYRAASVINEPIVIIVGLAPDPVCAREGVRMSPASAILRLVGSTAIMEDSSQRPFTSDEELTRFWRAAIRKAFADDPTVTFPPLDKLPWRKPVVTELTGAEAAARRAEIDPPRWTPRVVYTSAG